MNPLTAKPCSTDPRRCTIAELHIGLFGLVLFLQLSNTTMKHTTRRSALARKALSVPMIARCVAIEAAELDSRYGHSSICAALARTCRVLYEPAMDVLWCDLLDLTHLLRCFPDDVWSMEDEGSFLVRSEAREGLLTSDHWFPGSTSRSIQSGRLAAIFGKRTTCA